MSRPLGGGKLIEVRRAIHLANTLVVISSARPRASDCQIDALVADVVPFAIGMADEIEDGDAINSAVQYSAGANGQSINSAHLSGRWPCNWPVRTSRPTRLPGT